MCLFGGGVLECHGRGRRIVTAPRQKSLQRCPQERPRSTCARQRGGSVAARRHCHNISGRAARWGPCRFFFAENFMTIVHVYTLAACFIGFSGAQSRRHLSSRRAQQALVRLGPSEFPRTSGPPRMLTTGKAAAQHLRHSAVWRCA